MGDRSQYEPNHRQQEPTNDDKQDRHEEPTNNDNQDQQEEPTNNAQPDATTNAMRAVSQDTSDEIAGPPDIRTEDHHGLHLLAKQLETWKKAKKRIERMPQKSMSES